MTDIEQKALALLGEVSPYKCEKVDHAHHAYLCAALRLSVERHEAFRQEVSGAVEKQAQTVWDIHCRCGTRHPISFNTLEQFIIKPKPDPLIEVLRSVGGDDRDYCDYPIYAKEIRAALDALGFEIREKNDD